MLKEKEKKWFRPKAPDFLSYGLVALIIGVLGKKGSHFSLKFIRPYET